MLLVIVNAVAHPACCRDAQEFLADTRGSGSGGGGVGGVGLKDAHCSQALNPGIELSSILFGDTMVPIIE